jgi:hypothetical protein
MVRGHCKQAKVQAMTRRSDSKPLSEPAPIQEPPGAEPALESILSAAKELLEAVDKVQDWSGTRVGDAMIALDEAIDRNHGRTSRQLMECRRAAAKCSLALFVVHHSSHIRYVAQLPVVSDCDFIQSKLILPEGGTIEIVPLFAVEDKLRGTRAAITVDHHVPEHVSHLHPSARASAYRNLTAIWQHSTRVDKTGRQ